jgi:hypothetical protein
MTASAFAHKSAQTPTSVFISRRSGVASVASPLGVSTIIFATVEIRSLNGNKGGDGSALVMDGLCEAQKMLARSASDLPTGSTVR